MARKRFEVKSKFKLELQSVPQSTLIAKAAVSAFLMQTGTSSDEINDVRVSVSEAVENCIFHAYPDGAGSIFLTAILAGDEVTVSVRDCGIGIPNVKQARMPLFTTGSDGHAGMGFTIMESFMDKVSIISRPEKGTTVTMKRRITL